MDQISGQNSDQHSGESSTADKYLSSVGNDTTVDDKRSKKVATKSQRQGQDTPRKRSIERNASLQEQQLDIAQNKVVESQQREVDLRQMLKSVRKEYDKELKSVRQRYDVEKSDLIQQVSALSDALDKANESAAEWKEAHASQKNLLSVQIVQLHNECKAKHQAFVALQLKYDELEASAGHKAAAEQKNATREIEQLRTTLENLSSDKVKLQNALTVSLEDFQRLHQQLALMRKALKESDEKIKTQDSHLELVIREKETLHDTVRRKEHIEEELGHSLTKQIRVNDEMEEELCFTNAFLSSALEHLKVELDSFSFVFNQSKEELEGKVARLELGVDAQKRKIIHLSKNLHETELRLQDKESYWQEQTKSKVKELEDSHALKIEAWHQISLRQQESAKNLFDQQQAVLTDRIASLEMSVQELQGRIECEIKERESLIKEYEEALDELEENHHHELTEKLGHANRKFAEFETQSLQVTAELKQANAGLVAKNEVLERQVKESLADYKQELQILEGRYLKASKDYRADVEARTKLLEQDLSKFKAKNENLNKNMIEIMERHRQESEEKTAKFETARQGDEEWRQETTRKFQQKEKELQGKVAELKSEIKRLEHERLMEQKDRDTELALLRSSVENLAKKLKDRDFSLSTLQESLRLELRDSKLKFKAVNDELELRLIKEQEEASKRYDCLKIKMENVIRDLKEELNTKQLDLKISEEKTRCLIVSEQQVNGFLDDLKGQLETQAVHYREAISQLEESNQTMQKELQELKGIHHITQLRAEKQNEWNDRVVTELKEEIQNSRKLLKQMISIDQYKIDLDHIKAQSSATMSEALDEARNKFESEKKGLLEEIHFLQSKCRSALAGSVLPETDERAKLAFERNKAASELQQCRAELEGVRKAALWNEELMKRKESDLMRSLEREDQAYAERDDLKRCCESLETKVMVLEMEKKNIQQIEERKYQVEIMRLTTNNEELKRACKKAEQPSLNEPKGPASSSLPSSPEPDSIFKSASALSRVRARRLAAQNIG
eukprot:CAMPEP_0172205558 /NCGR_PEP_ID=MMETSP1050-20130122/32684_1 /TAXON_ID=233186 /ORGANISM="Cryptomonas curvata, Strain CCAP979/52" /LENGTH=1023 /DNA_ID=CAMNT_0012884453 /DNA_START=465 /DNA_END=3533 /DNA_ORIENTATION=+